MGLQGSCPLATMSNIYVDTSSNGTVHTYRLTPKPSAMITSLRGGQKNLIAVYDIREHVKQGMLNVATVHNPTKTSAINYPSILSANRYIIGEEINISSIDSRISIAKLYKYNCPRSFRLRPGERQSSHEAIQQSLAAHRRYFVGEHSLVLVGLSSFCYDCKKRRDS